MSDSPPRLVGTTDKQTLSNKAISGIDNPDLQVFPLNIDRGKNASASTFHRGDGAWEVPDYPVAPTATHYTAVLGSDVALVVGATTDGPHVAQGAGGGRTWFVVGQATITNTDSVDTYFKVILYDGLVVNASGSIYIVAGQTATACLSAIVTDPGGNLRIAVLSQATGTIAHNFTTWGKDTIVSAVQLL